MRDFYDFIKFIIEKPGVFAVNKIEDINFIIIGYEYGSKDIADPDLEKFQSGFNGFLCNKYNMNWKLLELDSEVHWCRLIRFFSGSDSHTINLFRDNFKDFFNYEKVDS
jgi:hypothetical protein